MGSSSVISEQKCAAALAQLLSGPEAQQSPWVRKSQLLLLEGELSVLELRLVEFDVALRFNEARELAQSAEKLFQTDKSSDRVRHRIAQLFTALLNNSDKQFCQDLVAQLSMDTLQEMFFFAFPDQRNSTRGSLQVYLIWASNQPQSLRKIATKLFAYYLGASGEYQQKSQSPHPEQEVTPMDAVLFHLFGGLLQSDFGDLSLHNIVQMFHILLRNCFADSMSRLGEDFYSQSGIPFLASIARPSHCWHFCLRVLALLFVRRAQPALALALRPSPSSPDSDNSLSSTLEKAMADPEATPELMQSTEFVHLLINWAMVSPIRNSQLDLTDQLVCLPANIFWVTPSALEHYWLYNLETEVDDSPAEIGEEPQRQKSPRIDHRFMEPIRLLNTLFSSSPVAHQQLVALRPSLIIPNLHSLVVLSLMVSENWKKAAELLKLSESLDLPPTERIFLRLQQLQVLVQLRKIPKAFSLCLELLRELYGFNQDTSSVNIHELPPAFPIVVAHDPAWIRLSHPWHLRLFLLLQLFHIFWLCFAKCLADNRQKSDGNDELNELFFLSLVVLSQCCWPDFGFGLFEELCEHVAAKDKFRCPSFFRYVSNAVLMDELLGLEHVQQMALAHAEPEHTTVFRSPAEWHALVMEGKVRLAGGSGIELLEQFLEDHQRRINDDLLPKLFPNSN